LATRIEAFVLHMPGSASRRTQVERIIAACPVACRPLEAVDGRAMSEEDRALVYQRQVHTPRYPFALRPGEIGCFLSHRRAWQSIIDLGLCGGLILEDDVELERPGFDRALEVSADAIRSSDLVRLRLMHRTPRLWRARGECRVERPAVTPLGTQAQLVSRAGARRLLDATARFDRPIDVFLQMHWIPGIMTCEVAPSHVVDRTADLGGSTIQPRVDGVSARIGRNLRRTWYRARIRALSSINPSRPAPYGP
jgi:glycosyl transferase family 25